MFTFGKGQNLDRTYICTCVENVYTSNLWNWKEIITLVYYAWNLNEITTCKTSQLRVLNGRFVGDLCGNYTCHKSYGASTVDYALTHVDLFNVFIFFHVSNPTYLSDHSQISVHVNCKINEHYSPNSNINNFINYSYKWESISKDKWLNTLSEPDTLNEIISFGNEQFEKNKKGINNAPTQLTNIFEKLAQQIL